MKNKCFTKLLQSGILAVFMIIIVCRRKFVDWPRKTIQLSEQLQAFTPHENPI